MHTHYTLADKLVCKEAGGGQNPFCHIGRKGSRCIPFPRWKGFRHDLCCPAFIVEAVPVERLILSSAVLMGQFCRMIRTLSWTRWPLSQSPSVQEINYLIVLINLMFSLNWPEVFLSLESKKPDRCPCSVNTIPVPTSMNNFLSD